MQRRISKQKIIIFNSIFQFQHFLQRKVLTKINNTQSNRLLYHLQFLLKFVSTARIENFFGRGRLRRSEIGILKRGENFSIKAKKSDAQNQWSKRLLTLFLNLCPLYRVENFFEGEGYEDPSVERVSLFGDRDDVQGDLFVKVCCFCCWFTNDEVDDDDGDILVMITTMSRSANWHWPRGPKVKNQDPQSGNLEWILIGSPLLWFHWKWLKRLDFAILP